MWQRNFAVPAREIYRDTFFIFVLNIWEISKFLFLFEKNLLGTLLEHFIPLNFIFMKVKVALMWKVLVVEKVPPVTYSYCQSCYVFVVIWYRVNFIMQFSQWRWFDLFLRMILKALFNNGRLDIISSLQRKRSLYFSLES